MGHLGIRNFYKKMVIAHILKKVGSFHIFFLKETAKYLIEVVISFELNVVMVVL